MHLDIDPTTPVKKLTVAKQQMIEIAKALNNNSELFVMDEPTSPLTDTEIEELFRFIRQLRAAGRGIIYISHRLEELWRISDRITVMRDGQYVGTVNTADVNRQQIISMMVGRVIYEEPKQCSTVPKDAPIVLEAKHLNAQNVKDVFVYAAKGVKSSALRALSARDGRRPCARSSCADPRISGEVLVKGQKVEIHSPSDAVKNGIGYLSEDRKTFGIATGLSVRDNSVMADLKNYCTGPIMNDKKIDAIAEEYIKKISIKTPSLRQLVKNLSGGNQQKIVIAKWLIKKCDVLIFDEPTRGIDVGAKSEIYKLMEPACGGREIDHHDFPRRCRSYCVCPTGSSS